MTDDSHRGMGTTLTAAKVTGDEVSLGHVGDSRAYRLRDGQLEQLTSDHSLVAELERSGQITPEAAEHHPQRSIITRALGPEPDVQVDTYTLAGPRRRPLPDLLRRPDEHDLRRRARLDPARPPTSLEEAAESLVRAANQSGGKDNITVVLFRLGDGEGGRGGPREDETIAGQLSRDRACTRPRSTRPPSRTRSRAADARRRARRRDDRGGAAKRPRPAPPRRQPRRAG